MLMLYFTMLLLRCAACHVPQASSAIMLYFIVLYFTVLLLRCAVCHVPQALVRGRAARRRAAGLAAKREIMRSLEDASSRGQLEALRSMREAAHSVGM